MQVQNGLYERSAEEAAPACHTATVCAEVQRKRTLAPATCVQPDWLNGAACWLGVSQTAQLSLQAQEV